jgi:hypothetical protein
MFRIWQARGAMEKASAIKLDNSMSCNRRWGLSPQQFPPQDGIAGSLQACEDQMIMGSSSGPRLVLAGFFIGQWLRPIRKGREARKLPLP